MAFATIATSTPKQASTTTELIKAVFGTTTPIAVNIARCESNLRQFDETGKVLHGNVVHADTGLFQINTTYHKEEITETGLDINTVMGNIIFAKLLFDQQGTQPWSASKDCWNVDNSTK